uniref:Uncharacterized protein n=1 Tax=Gouania willdenowi TaxID=441366 RepID=A0A8C5GZH9_GOUWI
MKSIQNKIKVINYLTYFKTYLLISRVSMSRPKQLHFLPLPLPIYQKPRLYFSAHASWNITRLHRVVLIYVYGSGSLLAGCTRRSFPFVKGSVGGRRGLYTLMYMNDHQQ